MTVQTGNLTMLTGSSPDSAPDRHALALRLIAQADELMAIAAALEGGGASAKDPSGELALMRAIDETNSTHLARGHYRDRRLRGQIFDDAALFGEPAWDLLLDLFIAAREQKRVPVTSACIGAAVPTTTALRWLTILDSQGLTVREADPADARRVFVRLSTDGYARMAEYFRRSSQRDRIETSASPRVAGQRGFMFTG